MPSRLRLKVAVWYTDTVCSNGNHTPEKSCGFSTGPCKKPFSTKQTWGSLEITQAPNNSSLQTKGVNQKEMVNFTDNKLLHEGLAWSATRSLQRTHSYTSAIDDYSPTWINEGHFWWNFPKQNRVGWVARNCHHQAMPWKPSGRFWTHMESFWLPWSLGADILRIWIFGFIFRNAGYVKKITCHKKNPSSGWLLVRKISQNMLLPVIQLEQRKSEPLIL